jgi:hypothetical protein
METEQKYLTRWTFEQEMLKIPAKCRKLTNKTSKEKVKELFKKYEFLISYNKETVKHHEKKADRLECICNALKRGTVKYDGGFFMISEILRIKVNEENVVVFFKNGTEQSFVKHYEWLNDLF